MVQNTSSPPVSSPVAHIYDARVEEVRHIIRASPVIPAHVVGVLNHTRSQRCDRHDPEAFRPSVVEKQSIVPRETMLDGGEKAIVVRADSVVAKRHLRV